MDYEKAYKEALERARKLWSEAKANEYTSDIEDYETIFPELAESKDEKIRKEMIEHFKSKTKETWCNIPVKDIIAYLEKQKELPTNEEMLRTLRTEYEKGEWSEEDENMRWNVISIVGESKSVQAEEMISWLKSLRPQPKQEWSEEDENTIESIKGLITMGRFADTNTIRTIWKLLDSLRPSWKPSEEQMEALNALNCHGDLSYVGQQNQLISLYNDLKKLM